MIFYEDDEVRIYEEGIKLKWYYFPVGISKLVRWKEIKKVEVEKLNGENGLFRIWGTNSEPYWLGLSFTRRWKKSQDLFIIDNGRDFLPAFTPARASEVKELLASKGLLISKES